MKFYSLLLFSLLTLTGGIGNIAKVNEYKGLAENAFQNEKYEEAVDYYRYLIDTLGENDANIRLNLGHSYYRTKQEDKAMELYSSLSAHEDPALRSKANNQLGIIHTNQQKLKEALEFFKASLRADPTNEGTRYNYELVKKLLEEQEKKEQEKKNQDKEQQDKKEENEENKEDQENKENQEQNKENQESQDQQEQEQKDQGEKQDKEGEKKPQEGKEKESDKEEKAKEQQKQQQQQRMKEINMSEDRAKMLLEAMKNQEMQYYQQLRKKAKARKESRDKPDW